MEAKVSQTYALAFLVKHPASRKIVLRYLTPLGIDESRLSGVDSTLSSLMDNTGGGIPYQIIVLLIEELDCLTIKDY